MIEHLRDHARNEETYIHPLLQRLGAAADLEQEHRELDNQLATLESIVRGGHWAELYPVYAAFLAPRRAARTARDIPWAKTAIVVLTSSQAPSDLQHRGECRRH